MTGYLYANTINTSERGGVIWQDTWMDGDQERHAQWRLGYVTPARDLNTASH
ncbi:MAG: hypothetical protein R3A10_04705 [Caldilineaceae bacterium]